MSTRKLAIVTGASTGIGLEIAKLAAKDGYDLLVAGSLRVDGEWGLANYRALSGTGDDQALLAPVTSALGTSLRTAVDATWMALLVGVVTAGATRPVGRVGTKVNLR